MHPTAAMLLLAGCDLRARETKDTLAPVYILRDCSKPSAFLIHVPDKVMVEGRASRAIDADTWEVRPDSVWTITRGVDVPLSMRTIKSAQPLRWDAPEIHWIWPTLPMALVRKFIENWR